MKRIPTIILITVFFSALIGVYAGCWKKQDAPQENDGRTAQSDPNRMSQAPPPVQDVSTAALVKIDPAIQDFADGVQKAKSAYEHKPGQGTKDALIGAYIAFGDYMQYESPVSPRKGKYRRALMEYRHALKLDPKHAKAMKEIQQIEDIYRSMNRPIPTGDEV